MRRKNNNLYMTKLEKGNGYADDNHFPLAFFLLFLSASYPFSFGNLGPIPEFLWVEGLAPIMLFLGCLQLLRKRQHPLPSGGGVFVSAICVLGLWAYMNFVFNPVSSAHVLGAGKSSMGIRSYYRILVGISVFFCGMWFSCHWAKGERCWGKILKTIISISLIIGFARLGSYFLDFELPLLKGTFDYGGQWIKKAHRIGGLSEAATLGLAALLGLYYRKKWSGMFVLSFMVFIFLLLMSGGRSASFGAFMAFLIYILFIEKGRLGRSALLGCILIGILLPTLHFAVIDRQLERITAIEGGLSKQSPGRSMAFQHMREIFQKNPIMGKGIGWRPQYGRIDPFVSAQLGHGGHGAYLSILAIFGLGGAFFLFVMLFLSIFKAFFLIRKNKKSINPLIDDQLMTVVFILASLIILSFEFIVGGDGYSNTRLFLFAGILSGILSRKRNET